jgi:hypothetical protein
MPILEKIQHKSLNEINLYLEGVFWISYEQSVYYFWKLKGYKPTKKFVKVANQEVVSVGFPGKVLDEIKICRKQKEEGKKHIVSEAQEAIDEGEFLKWKEELILLTTSSAFGAHPFNKLKRNYAELSVIKQIRNFDLLSKTPMECMNFLAELKKLTINH